MHISRAGSLLFRCCSLLLLSLCVQTRVAFARPSQEGGARDDVRALLAAVGERPKDAEAWFRLGVAHSAAGDAGESLKAFRQAAKLRADFVAARAGVAYALYSGGKLKEAAKEAAQAVRRVRTRADYVAYGVNALIQGELQNLEAARELAKAGRELAKKPEDARWHLRKAFALLAAASTERKLPPFSALLSDRESPRPPPPPPPDENALRAARESARRTFEEAAASFEKYLDLKPRADDREFVLRQLEALRYYTRATGERGSERAFHTSEVKTKALIYSKPEPGFTEKARKSNVTGVVRLRAVLSAEGDVRHVLVLKHLSHGLTERAIAAAHAIRFKPASVDGAPVSQYVILEYNFNIY